MTTVSNYLVQVIQDHVLRTERGVSDRIKCKCGQTTQFQAINGMKEKINSVKKV